MSNHWRGVANVPGTVVLVVAIADTSHIITYVVVSVFICFMGLIIWSMVDANLRRIRSGQSSAQLLKAAERLRKDVEEWSLPPELNLPTPRQVRSAPLGARLLRSLPRIIFLTVLAIFIYTVAFLYTHVIPAAREESVPSFLFQAFLTMARDFLQAPRWQHWMLWPSVIFGGIAGLSALPGHFKRRKGKKLLRWGKPARAVVTGVFHHPGGPKSSGSTESKLEYQDDADNLVKGYVDRKLFQGQVVTVLYDPDKPSRFTTYPVAGYEIGVPENL
ncbi:MAG: hypothetical protein ABSF71_32285 [Terriglobia bacterium]|jgi:hypothetical protein